MPGLIGWVVEDESSVTEASPSKGEYSDLSRDELLAELEDICRRLRKAL